MTYMSITQEWQKLVADGWLYRLPPFPGDPSKRVVLLSPEMQEVVTQQMDEGEDSNRRSRLVASLQHIVAGRVVVACLNPHRARLAHVGRLDPIGDGIWDVRCQEAPALRVFGRFIEADVFLAATCRPRSKPVGWLGWLPLGPSDSKEWKNGRAATIREWNKVLPAHAPVTGENLDEYLSNASLE